VSGSERVCEKCGSPAIVHITTDSGHGMIVRHLCLACADAEDMPPATRDRRLDHAAILVVSGLLVLVISVGADLFAFGSTAGFGWRQWTGVALGLFLVFVGAVIQVPTVMVIGLITGLLTLLADWLGLGNAQGFGVHQLLGALLGMLMIGAGLLAGRRKGPGSPGTAERGP